MISAAKIFEQHYGSIKNPLTPVPVEYGFLNNAGGQKHPVYAYEISRSHDGTKYGMTVLRYQNGSAEEVREFRRVGRSLDEIRQAIADIITTPHQRL